MINVYIFSQKQFKAVMKDRGNALIGIGMGVGENRAADAAREAGLKF